MRPAAPSALALLAVCSLLSACDDADSTVTTSPTAFKNQLDVVSIIPDQARADRSLLRCPTASPVTMPFILNVTAGTSPVTLMEVRVQPTNPFGRTEPPTIFDSSSLTRQFGNVTVDSFDVRQFAFVQDVRCDMRGSLLGVSVTTRDGSGRSRMSALQLPVNYP